MTTSVRTMTAGGATGPLAGVRVLELSSEMGAFAGKLCADMGAVVTLIEPPAGDRTRGYGPFVDDVPNPERSLWFWHYNTSKRGVTLDIEQEQGRDLLRKLAATADLVIEAEAPGRLARLGLDYPDLQALNPRLILVSITPFGRSTPRAEEQATDLTILAGGGPAWSCGYDDHTLPPVRGGGNQGYQTGCHFAVMSALVALLARQRTGRGQHVDVNMHAAANVTTESGSYSWLVARQTVQRQTGRHAATVMTMPSQIQCADGRWVNTGIPPRSSDQFKLVHAWLDELDLLEHFDQTPILELAIEGPTILLNQIMDDPEAAAKFAAGRAAINFIAEHIPAYDFFIGGQQRNFQFSIIYSPEEALEDQQFAARGFPVEVQHPELGRGVRYPGAPYRFTRTPWSVRPAPALGQDNADVYGGLGLDQDRVAALRAAGVI